MPHRLSYAGHPLTDTAEELHAAVDQLEADTVPESYYQKVLARKFSDHARLGARPYFLPLTAEPTRRIQGMWRY
jgi:hypothetical protein